MEFVIAANVIFFESGLQFRSDLNAPLDFVSCRFAPVPSAGIIKISYPFSVESSKNAIDFPSGLQVGSRSATPFVGVKLRGIPFSAGRVHISPRAATIARFPVGEMSHPSMNALASIICGRNFERAPGILTLTVRVSRVARLRTIKLAPF